MDAEKLRKDIAEILVGADLSQLSARKVRIQLEEKYKTSLTNQKAEIDKMVIQELDKIEEKNEGEKEEKKQKEKDENQVNGIKRKRDEEEEDDDDDGSDEEDKATKKTEDDEDMARQLQEEEEDNCQRRTRHSNKKRTPGNKEKKEKKPRKKGAPRENSFTQTCNLSSELATVMGEDKMRRSDVVKKMWEIVREKNLFDPKNKRFMICDDQMLSLFGKKRVLLFGMMKYLNNHIFKREEVFLS